MPLFSVVIPTYNRSALLCEALDSVFAQRCSDYEIIVVDDGSTDDTERALTAYRDKIQYLRQANQGPSQARNYGVSKARGDYITFLDSDDFFLPWTLEIYQQVIERFDQPTLILGSMANFTEENELAELAPQPLDATRWDDYLQSAAARYPIAIPGAIKREALQQIGGFAVGNICSEGHDLYLRLGLAPGFAMVSEPPAYAYRQHAITQSRDIGPLYRGARLLLGREHAGAYPGGKARRAQRASLLMRSLQYSVRRCFEWGNPLRAVELYLRALPQYVRAGRQRDAWRDGRVAARQLKTVLKTSLSKRQRA